MGKGDFKKISSGPIWLKADLDVRHFLGMKRERKRWMKNVLNRYERRRGNDVVKNIVHDYEKLCKYSGYVGMSESEEKES